MFARTIRQSRSLSIMARRSRQPDTRRFNSTKPNVSSSHVLKSPILTGAVGGLTALCGGYAWYYFSGTKEIVDAARSTIKPLESRKATIAYRTPSKNEILSFIKLNRSPHVLFIPGTSTAFEELEELASFDGKELEKIVLDAHNDLRGVIGEGGGMDPETTQKFMDIFILLTGQLQNLAKDAGIKFLDDRPQFRHGVEILEEYGKRYGPETQKIVDETMKQIQEIINQGSSASGLSKAAQLVNEKTREIRKVGREAAEKEWESGIKEVNPYLDKLPQDVKKIVDENIDSVKGLVLSRSLPASMIPDVFKKIRDATTSEDIKENVSKLKDYFSKLGQNDDQASFFIILTKKSPNGKKIVNETAKEKDKP